MDTPRFDVLFREAAAEMLDANPALRLTGVLTDGTDANMIAAGIAAMGTAIVSQLAQTAAGLTEETASGAPLVRLGRSRHGILPNPAAPPFVDLAFARAALPSPVVTSFTIPSGTKVRSSDNKQYETVLDLIVPAGTTVPMLVRARSTLAGSSQSVAAGKLTSIVSTIAGAPTDLTVTNPLASAGGADAEGEDAYKIRLRLEPRSRAKATDDALRFAALSFPGVVSATTFAGLDSAGRENRIVAMVISDKYTDGLVRQGVTVPAYELQSQAFARVVEQYLSDTRALGIHVGVIVAQVNMLSVTLRLRFRANANTEVTRQAATAATVNLINSLVSGASFNPANLVAGLRAIPGLDVRGDEVANPVGIVTTSSPYQVLRTSKALIQFTTSVGASSEFSIITV